MKMHVSSSISDIKLRYMCMDGKYFYLNNCMDRTEYIMLQIFMIPQQFIDKYNIKNKVHNVYIFAQGTKGIYGLPKSG